jgi:hypothetical protein
MTRPRTDLVALVADKNMEAAIQGLLARPQALQVRPLTHHVHVHPYRDPGCCREGVDFLRPFVKLYEYALLIFDHEGCGREEDPPEAIEGSLRQRLEATGWGDRAAVIVLQPELEIWVWSDSPEVARSLGWTRGMSDLRRWLGDEELWPEESVKPPDPKAAVERTLRHVRKPRSSALYESLARSVSLQRCTDPAFAKLRQVLMDWFPQG